MISKNTLKSILTFTENQNPAPSFIAFYIVTWLAWHNQLFTYFINAEGGVLSKVSSALNSLDDNQYLLVFFLTCLLFLLRLGFNYFSFRSREILNSVDDNFANAREDQKFAANSDVANLMATLTKTQQQLADTKVREKKAIADKTATIKELLNVQHQLDEARADIEMLNNTQKLQSN